MNYPKNTFRIHKPGNPIPRFHMKVPAKADLLLIGSKPLLNLAADLSSALMVNLISGKYKSETFCCQIMNPLHACGFHLWTQIFEYSLKGLCIPRILHSLDQTCVLTFLVCCRKQSLLFLPSKWLIVLHNGPLCGALVTCTHSPGTTVA